MSAPLPNAVNEENSKREKMNFVQNHLKREKNRIRIRMKIIARIRIRIRKKKCGSETLND